MAKGSGKKGPVFKHPMEREEAMVQVAKLDRMGYTQARIGAVVGLSQPTIHLYLKEIKKRYHDSIIEDRATLVNEKKAQLRDLMAECWDAWERSKQDTGKTVTEEVPKRECKYCDGTGSAKTAKDGTSRKGPYKEHHCLPCGGTGKWGGITKIVKTTEGRLPPTEYLKVIAQCLQIECDLEGLYAPKKYEPVGQVIDWDTLLANIPKEDEGDTVEEKIAKALEVRDTDEVPATATEA